MSNRKQQHTDLESVPVGYANGVAPGFPLTDKEKQKLKEIYQLYQCVLIIIKL